MSVLMHEKRNEASSHFSFSALSRSKQRNQCLPDTCFDAQTSDVFALYKKMQSLQSKNKESSKVNTCQSGGQAFFVSCKLDWAAVKEVRLKGFSLEGFHISSTQIYVAVKASTSSYAKIAQHFQTNMHKSNHILTIFQPFQRKQTILAATVCQKHNIRGKRSSRTL